MTYAGTACSFLGSVFDLLSTRIAFMSMMRANGAMAQVNLWIRHLQVQMPQGS